MRLRSQIAMQTRQRDERLIAAYAKGPMTPGELKIEAAKADTPAEILIYDAIGGSYWDEGVMPVDVIAALATIGSNNPVTVRINSPGGDVFDGVAIYNALMAHKGEVTTQIDGLAASAASIIMLAGKTVNISPGAMVMIHNSATMAYGQATDLMQTAAILGKIDATMAEIYSAKSGKAVSDMKSAMDAETWYTADEALSIGLVDAVIGKAVEEKPADAKAVAHLLAGSVQASARERRLRLALASQY